MGSQNWALCMRVFVGFVMISSLPPLCAALTDPRDVGAINSLYISLGYPPLQGWLLVGGDPCGDHWEGVNCVFWNITDINLSGMNLGGALGGALDFASIITMDLSNNHIGGTFPSNLPVTLRNFSLSGNQITGTIPDSLSSLTQLLQLSVKDNLLSGEIPDSFQLLTSLTILDLSGNNLSGQLPPSMGNLSSLSSLHLQNNKLTGVLDVLQDLHLMDLNIENNLFSGPIPASLLSIPTFRSDGNPFNTTVIPSSPAPAPMSPAGAPYSEETHGKQANGPSATQILDSLTSRKFLTARTVTWIAAIGAMVLLVLALGLCLFLSRCCKGRKMDEIEEKHNVDTYNAPREKPKYNDSSLQPNYEMEKVSSAIPKEGVSKPLDGCRVDNRRTGLNIQTRGEQEIDAKKVATSSRHKKDHAIDMAGSTLNSTGFHLPPPPPSFLTSEKVIVNPIVPAENAMKRPPTNSVSSCSASVFTIASLQQYTNSFSEDNFIGEGTLGSVYRADLPNGKQLAVKKLDTLASSQQSDEEFLEMVSGISKLKHANIVELLGYCLEHGQRLLVYEYCKNGTLHDALQVDDEMHKKLSWNARIQLALGAARALEYLHEVCHPPIIHHNFKSANILLDDQLLVRVSDCGLAPLLSSGSTSQLSGHLLTAYGYGSLEFESGSYTYQSDIYSFGVVMLELLTGRKSYERSRPRGEQFLVRWAIPQLHDINALSRMADPFLNGAYPIKALSRFADIISLCLQREPEFRPPMSEIVQSLLNMIQREV